MSDSYEKMMRELTSAVIADTGLTESIARKCAESTMTVLQERKAANGWLYVHNPKPRIDELAIRGDFAAGKSMNQICRDHRTTRRRLKQEFPDLVATAKR